MVLHATNLPPARPPGYTGFNRTILRQASMHEL